MLSPVVLAATTGGQENPHCRGCLLAPPAWPGPRFLVMLQPSVCSSPMSLMSKSVMIVSAMMPSSLSVSLVR